MVRTAHKLDNIVDGLTMLVVRREGLRWLSDAETAALVRRSDVLHESIRAEIERL